MPRAIVYPRASLLGLPAELRSRIWEQLFEGHSAMRTWLLVTIDGKACIRTKARSHTLEPTRRELGLFRTCRTIYEETAAMFYHACAIEYEVPNDATSDGGSCSDVLLSDMKGLWRFVGDLNLHIVIWEQLRSLHSLDEFVMESLDRGEHLQRLTIDLVTATPRLSLGTLNKIMMMLKSLNVNGHVLVSSSDLSWRRVAVDWAKELEIAIRVNDLAEKTD